MSVRKTTKRTFMVLAVVIIILSVTISLFAYLSTQKPYSGDPQPLTLGVYPSEYNSLVYIAVDKGYFTANGLKVTLKNYTSGSVAIDGLLKGEVDISTGSEFVIARNVMLNANITALGSLSKYLNVYLVARTDRDINTPNDLVGKKIGVSLGTAIQFFLGRYLEVNGLAQNQVSIVNMNFAESPNALSNGTVDAVATFQPYINQIQSLMAPNVSVWPMQADQYGYFDAICTWNWKNTHSDLIESFLKALTQAENFNVNHKDEAITLVARDLNSNKTYMSSVWSEFQYSVTLDQSFILLMQEEARWLITNNLTNATTIPNFLNYIYVDGLKSVKSGAVNIIGIGD